MKKNIVGIIAVILCAGIYCTPPIVFTRAQPIGIASSNQFDPIYQGTFYCTSDNSMVVINEKTIYKRHWFDFVIAENRIEEDPILDKEDDFLIIDKLGRFPIQAIEKDSIYASMWLTDTLFSIDDERQMLKYYQGYQILNFKLEEDKYEVVLLSLDENAGIAMKYASLPEDLDRLKKITAVQDLSTEAIQKYRINPTQMEFDEILRQEIIFETCEYFQRVALLNFLDHLD